MKMSFIHRQQLEDLSKMDLEGKTAIVTGKENEIYSVSYLSGSAKKSIALQNSLTSAE